MEGAFGERLGIRPEQARALVVRSESSARAGSLTLRSGDLELDNGLGPEISDVAPAAYDRRVLICDPETAQARARGEFRVSATSDLRGPAHDAVVCAAAELRSIQIDVAPRVRLRAASISTRIRLAKEGAKLTRTIDVLLEEAILDLGSLGVISLPSHPRPDQRILPALLEPAGMRLTVNARRVAGVHSKERAIRVAALRLTFARAAIEGIVHSGEVAVGIANVGLEIETGRPAPAPAVWQPAIAWALLNDRRMAARAARAARAA